MNKMKLDMQISKEIIKLIIILILLIIMTVAGTWLLYNGLNDSTSEKYQKLNSSNTNLLDYCREFNKCGINATCTLNETAKNYSCYTHDSLVSQNVSYNFNKTHYTKGNFLMFTSSSMSESIEDSWTFKVPNLSVDNITIIPSTCSSSSSKHSLYSVDYLKRKIFFICSNDNDNEDDDDEVDDDDDDEVDDDDDDDDNDDDDENEGNSYVLKTMSYNGTDEKAYMENLTDNKTRPTFAIDWISRNIFWMNHTLNTIFVASLNNSSMKLSLINNISNAKYICVHPGRGKIYWLNNCGKSCQIETANEDGSNRSIFLSGFQVREATLLIIDITSDKLCWVGGKNIAQFKCADIEKKSIKIISDEDLWSTIVAVSDDTYYWTKNKHQIYYMDKKKSSKSRFLIDARNNEPVENSLYVIENLIFIPENIPPVTNLCQRENGGCSFDELCLPKGQHGVTCRKA